MRIGSTRGTVISAVLVALLPACDGGPPATGSPTANPPEGLSVDGVPVICGDTIELSECARRADGALNHSLEPPHPPVVRIVVTCDADLCDADEGSGQVIVHFNDGTRYIVDVGFGITTN